VLAERMKTMQSEYKTDIARLAEDMAKRDVDLAKHYAELAKRDAEMAKRHKDDIKWFAGMFVASTIIIVGSIGLMLSL